jgi:hypothetical protein
MIRMVGPQLHSAIHERGRTRLARGQTVPTVPKRFRKRNPKAGIDCCTQNLETPQNSVGDVEVYDGSNRGRSVKEELLDTALSLPS